MPKIANPVRTQRNVTTRLTYLKGLRLAHPTTLNDDFEISLLIGADFYWDFIEDEVIRGDGPTAVKSKVGYLLSGPTHALQNGVKSGTSVMNIVTLHREEECQLHKFWEIESCGTETDQDSKTKELLDVVERYQESSISYRDNQYFVKLPWKSDHEELPTNEQVARTRTANVIKRLSKDPEMFRMYSDIIKDQERRGFIEKVPDSELQETGNQVHYIPHHPVKKESSTTPIRIVYDCSCHQNSDSPSLNDCLSSSPPILNKVTDLLVRFRYEKYGIVTDIEKAFLQIGLESEDRDVTRFFWLKDPSDPSSEMTVYRFKAVLFGATCSPFILNATLLKHLSMHGDETSTAIQRDLYVDNVLTSVSSQDCAVAYFSEARKLLADGGFNLRSWMSNSEDLNTHAQSENVHDTDEETKVLGMRWNAKTDVLTFARRDETASKPATKREILRQSASIYDPLGLLGPVTVRYKLLIQTLWKDGYAWDEILPEELQAIWNDLDTDIRETIQNIQIPRFLFAPDQETEGDTILHVFVDASQRVYGACAYLCRGSTSVLVIAKNRIAPLKGITLPKLELMAAVIGARIGNQLRQALEIKRTVFWSDSQIVLHWLSSSKPLCKFVKKRVNEINDATQDGEWRYVPTDSNPADLQTRGLSGKHFKESTLWMRGPNWILDETCWPTWIPSVTHETSMLMTTDVNAHGESLDFAALPGISKIMDISRFSSLRKLMRVTSYVLKFVKQCRKKRAYNLRSTDARKPEEVTSDDVQTATRLWIIDVQNERFTREKDLISKNMQSKGSPLLKQLRLFVDEHDVIRCAGRIHNSPLDDCAKFPVLLPKKHRLTDLIILDTHRKLLHSGAGQTITEIRQKLLDTIDTPMC